MPGMALDCCSVAQSDALESVQKCAIYMIYSGANYNTSLIVAGIDSLQIVLVY